MEGADDDTSMDDSLADFKSPRLEPVARSINKPKILNDRRTKKTTNGTKRRKPETSRNRNEERVQPSIEASFFKAAAMSNRDEGHTCPLCMKYFEDASLGTAHSKNCAARNNVSTKKLLTAVALQKRQADERLAIGLPAGPFVQPKNKTPRRPREPVSNVDPELQLALALSKSLQEKELEQEFETALLLAAGHRGEEPAEMTSSQRGRTLKNFGFSTDKPSAPGIPEGPLKSRRRKHLGPTVLQTRSQESRDRLLSDRIAEVLMGNEAITQLSQCANSEQVKKPAWILKSRLLNEIHRTTERLWDSARLSPKLTNFYVSNLGPVVTPVHDRQPEIFVPEDAPADRPIDENCPSNENPPEGVEKIAAANSPSSERRAIEAAKSSTIETRNVHVTDREYRNTLPADWSSILNVSSMSDLVIIVKSSHVWAHKLVLHVRCCDILLDSEPNDDAKYAHVKERVCWPDVDFLIATAFLEFVYSGIIDRNEHIFEDNRALAGVRRLARKYRLKDLFDYLRKRKLEFGIRRDAESRRKGLRDPIVVDVSEIVNEIANLREHRTKYEENRENRESNEDIHGGDDSVEENRMKIGKIEEMNVEDDAIPGNRYKVDTITEIHVSNDAIQENRSKTAKVDEILLPGEPIQESLLKSRIIEEIHCSNDSIQENRSKAAKTKEHPDLDLTTQENQPEAHKLEQNLPTDSKLEEIPIEESAIFATSDRGVSDECESEAEEVVTVSSSDRASTVSPDLFDETMQRSLRPNESSSPEASRHSIGQDSNLKVLARLMEDDVSSERSSRESASTLENKPENENSRSSENVREVTTPAKRTYDRASEASRHAETPRSRGADEARLGCSAQPKARSNLSLFIEKVRKINSKPASDSCTDEESVAGALDRRRFRNPFKLDSASNPSTPRVENAVKIAREDADRNEETTNRCEISPESVGSINDTFRTDDEDVSVYSKYRRDNKRDNSIAKYRDLLRKLHSKADPAENEKSDNETSTDDVAIDLTQESDEDQPASSSSSVHPRERRETINRILDTDSEPPNDPPARSDGGVEDIEDRGKKSSLNRVFEDFDRDAGERRESESSDGASERVAEATNGPPNSLVLSDLDVFEIDEEILLSNSLKSWENASPSNGNSGGPGENADEPNDDHHSRRSGSVEVCLIVGSSSGEAKGPRHSPRYPDSDVFAMNGEALARSSKHSQKSPLLRSPGRFEASRDAAESDGTEAKSDENDSSGRRRRPGSSPEYPYTNSSRTDEIFTRSLERLDDSPDRRRARSSRDARRSDDSKDPNKSQKRDPEPFDSTRSSPRDPNNSRFSCDFPEVDFFDNHEIFTQSFGTANVPCRAESLFVTGQRTPTSRSAILVSSSPEFDDNSDELLIGNGRDANKENSLERDASPVARRRDHAADGSSPLCHEELLSPRVGTHARGSSWRCDRDSSRSVRKLTARSVSMPESTLTSGNGRKRTRTPRKSARAAMSRELTPPRNYDAMDTPELKRELAKYGIKPQKRKRARQLLNHIYNELHRDIATEGSRESPPNEDDREAPPPKKISKISDRNSNDTESDRDLPSSQESLASQGSIIPEEMEFPEADVSPKGAIGPGSIKEAFVGLLEADKKLYMKVLTYEPLPFEVLHSTLKAQGLKCKQNDLMDFLDDECITFQMVTQSTKSRTRKNRGRNGPKRKDKNEAKKNRA